MKHSIWVVWILWGILLTAQAQAQTQRIYNQITGFQTLLSSDGVTYTFCPTCKGDKPIGDHPCTSSELLPYLYEWKFSDQDYSVASTPTRVFAGNASGTTTVHVTLRATGIKEERVGACIADPTPACTATYHLSMPPNEWKPVYEGSQDFVVHTSPAKMNIAAEYFTNCFQGLTKPSLCITHPYCKPLWGAKVVYPLAFYNPTKCDYVVNCDVHDQIFDTLAKIWVENKVTCENFAPSPEVSCDPNDSSFKFILPALSSRIVLSAHQLPAQSKNLDSLQHRVTLSATFSNASGIPGICDASIEASYIRNDTIVSTIDPNRKFIQQPKKIYQEGDWVEFTIAFKNVGMAKESGIYIEDLLDPQLDANLAQFVSGVIVGPNGLQKINPSQVKQQVLGDPNKPVYQISLADHRFTLAADEYGFVTFKVPVKVIQPSKAPQWMLETSEQLDTLENRGYTMFSAEGRVYTTDEVKFVVIHNPQRFRKEIYGMLIALLVVLLAAVVWRLRKRARANRQIDRIQGK